MTLLIDKMLRNQSCREGNLAPLQTSNRISKACDDIQPEREKYQTTSKHKKQPHLPPNYSKPREEEVKKNKATMSFLGIGRPQPTSEQKIAAVEGEMRMMADTYNR